MHKDLELKLLQKKAHLLSDAPPLVGEFITSIETATTLKTQIAYLGDLSLFFQYLVNYNPYFSNINLDNMTMGDLKVLESQDIRQFLSYLSHYTKTFTSAAGNPITQTYSNSNEGKKRKLSALRAFYSWLGKEKEVNLVDITQLVEVKTPFKNHIHNHLVDEEMTVFLETIIYGHHIHNEKERISHEKHKTRDLTLVSVLGLTGIRVSELVNLNIDDIILSKSLMMVTRKGGQVESIHLPRGLVTLLAQYLEVRQAIEGVSPTYAKALFLSQQKKRMTADTVRHMIKKYQGRCQMDVKLTPHTFRRSFAMKMYDMTNDIELVRDLLGQSSVETTRKYYAQSTAKRKEAIMADFHYQQKSHD